MKPKLAKENKIFLFYLYTKMSTQPIDVPCYNAVDGVWLKWRNEKTKIGEKLIVDMFEQIRIAYLEGKDSISFQSSELIFSDLRDGIVGLFNARGFCATILTPTKLDDYPTIIISDLKAGLGRE